MSIQINLGSIELLIEGSKGCVYALWVRPVNAFFIFDAENVSKMLIRLKSHGQ